MSRVRPLAEVPVEVTVLPHEERIEGAPAAGATPLATVGETEVGLWRMTEGTARDIEVDEVFVVLSGRAVIRFLDIGERHEVRTGDLVTLRAGERTEWQVLEALTKLYVA